jgi:hypothetical protein
MTIKPFLASSFPALLIRRTVKCRMDTFAGNAGRVAKRPPLLSRAPGRPGATCRWCRNRDRASASAQSASRAGSVPATDTAGGTGATGARGLCGDHGADHPGLPDTGRLTPSPCPAGPRSRSQAARRSSGPTSPPATCEHRPGGAPSCGPSHPQRRREPTWGGRTQAACRPLGGQLQ